MEGPGEFYGTGLLDDFNVGLLPSVAETRRETPISVAVPVAPVSVEMRIDPQDMQLYTRQQFEEHYGLGCTEWETALPMHDART
eukprot:COSAG02_NODE_59693_length_273_cov_0.931034_1_plen_83_part_01